jgi:hypothetical protein
MRVEGLRFLMDHAHSESAEWNLGCQENLADSSIPSPFLQDISHFLLFQYQFLGDLHMNFVVI